MPSTYLVKTKMLAVSDTVQISCKGHPRRQECPLGGIPDGVIYLVKTVSARPETRMGREP